MSKLALDPQSLTNLVARVVPGATVAIRDGAAALTLPDGMQVELETLVVAGKVHVKPLAASFRDVTLSSADGVSLTFEIL